MQIPAGFEGNLNIVFVAFQQRQQRDIDSWLPFVTQLAAHDPNLLVYETPGSTWTRCDGSSSTAASALGIPDHSTRTRTITLYTDRDALRQALDLPSQETMYVLVIDRQGRVLGGSRARSTPQRARSSREVQGR